MPACSRTEVAFCQSCVASATLSIACFPSKRRKFWQKDLPVLGPEAQFRLSAVIVDKCESSAKLSVSSIRREGLLWLALIRWVVAGKIGGDTDRHSAEYAWIGCADRSQSGISRRHFYTANLYTPRRDGRGDDGDDRAAAEMVGKTPTHMVTPVKPCCTVARLIEFNKMMQPSSQRACCCSL